MDREHRTNPLAKSDGCYNRNHARRSERQCQQDSSNLPIITILSQLPTNPIDPYSALPPTGISLFQGEITLDDHLSLHSCKGRDGGTS